MERLLQQRTVALSAKSLKLAAVLQYLHLKPSCTVPPLIQHHGDDGDDISGDDIIQKMFSDGLFSTCGGSGEPFFWPLSVQHDYWRLSATIGNHNKSKAGCHREQCQLLATVVNSLQLVETGCWQSQLTVFPQIQSYLFNSPIVKMLLAHRLMSPIS